MAAGIVPAMSTGCVCITWHANCTEHRLSHTIGPHKKKAAHKMHPKALCTVHQSVIARNDCCLPSFIRMCPRRTPDSSEAIIAPGVVQFQCREACQEAQLLHHIIDSLKKLHVLQQC